MIVENKEMRKFVLVLESTVDNRYPIVGHTHGCQSTIDCRSLVRLEEMTDIVPVHRFHILRDRWRARVFLEGVGIRRGFVS